jgi:hypothetical protein
MLADFIALAAFAPNFGVGYVPEIESNSLDSPLSRIHLRRLRRGSNKGLKKNASYGEICRLTPEGTIH